MPNFRLLPGSVSRTLYMPGTGVASVSWSLALHHRMSCQRVHYPRMMQGRMPIGEGGGVPKRHRKTCFSCRFWSTRGVLPIPPPERRLPPITKILATDMEMDPIGHPHLHSLCKEVVTQTNYSIIVFFSWPTQG
jgi:hypothetical protein